MSNETCANNFTVRCFSVQLTRISGSNRNTSLIAMKLRRKDEVRALDEFACNLIKKLLFYENHKLHGEVM